MRASSTGGSRGARCRKALSTYQRVWSQVEQLEQDAPTPCPESTATEIHSDRAVVEDFVTRLPEALRTELRLERESLRETLQVVRVADGQPRLRTCPICDQTLGKLTPQHLAQRGLALQDAYRRFPELGSTKGARLLIQPSPEGLLNTGQMLGMVVARAGPEPATFGL